jgi:hypothetical protein
MTKNGQTYTTNWNYFTLFGRSGRFCEYYRQEMCLVVYPKNHHFADQSADSGWKEQTVDYIP